MCVIVVSHVTKIDDRDWWRSVVCKNGDAFLEAREGNKVEVGIDAPEFVHVHVSNHVGPINFSWKEIVRLEIVGEVLLDKFPVIRIGPQDV